MNSINIFYDHIIEAAAQQNITIEEALTLFRNLGIKGLECPLWRLTSEKDTKELLSAADFKVASVYEFFDFPHDDTAKSLLKIDKCLETAAFFGADKILAVPGFNADFRQLGKVYDLLNQFCEKARSYKITVTVEDFDDKASPCSTTEGLELLLDNVEDLRITFDTGNFAYSLESVEVAYSRLKGKIVHVHLKDRSRDISRFNGDNRKDDIGGEPMYPCEVGDGYVGIDKIISLLMKDNYSGSFSIEHFGALNQQEYAGKSIENIRKFIGAAK